MATGEDDGIVGAYIKVWAQAGVVHIAIVPDGRTLENVPWIGHKPSDIEALVEFLRAAAAHARSQMPPEIEGLSLS